MECLQYFMSKKVLRMAMKNLVLNLVINGMPSIQITAQESI